MGNDPDTLAMPSLSAACENISVVVLRVRPPSARAGYSTSRRPSPCRPACRRAAANTLPASPAPTTPASAGGRRSKARPTARAIASYAGRRRRRRDNQHRSPGAPRACPGRQPKGAAWAQPPCPTFPHSRRSPTCLTGSRRPGTQRTGRHDRALSGALGATAMGNHARA